MGAHNLNCEIITGGVRLKNNYKTIVIIEFNYLIIKYIYGEIER